MVEIVRLYLNRTTFSMIQKTGIQYEYGTVGGFTSEHEPRLLVLGIPTVLIDEFHNYENVIEICRGNRKVSMRFTTEVITAVTNFLDLLRTMIDQLRKRLDYEERVAFKDDLLARSLPYPREKHSKVRSLIIEKER